MYPFWRSIALVAVIFSACVTADSGDDFSNNLFSDLAPLLALFGERVTMQFMSQSMGWADNIILAMAPLGIITIIVSAIRVGGPTWLKAVIGRARENLAVAEAEIMSSTSNEVCELWNGREVVRCNGSAPIREFIVLVPKSPEQTMNAPRVTVVNFDAASQFLKLREGHKCRLRSWGPKTSLDDTELGPYQCSPSDVIVTRYLSPSHPDNAPNISLNSHDQIQGLERYFAAALGIIVQLSVLVYSGFATYYPTLKFQKDGNPVARYSFPCTGVGTFLLVTGIFVCAHVVDASTIEETREVDANKSIFMVWLQQKKTVSDQVFNSSAIFPRKNRTSIVTSTRTKEKLEFRAVLGTSIGLCGFIVQFIGLRGMHWTASITQLGAIIIMTILRVWIRRKLATPPQGIPLDRGFELEWLTLTLADIDKAPWLKASSNEAINKKWIITTTDSSKYYTELKQGHESESEAHRVMMMRRDIGKLANWPGPASAEAVALARAIEVTLDSLLEDFPKDVNLTWSLRSHYPAYQDQPHVQEICFRIKRTDGIWEVYADEIEAALSLWLYCVNEKEHDQGKQGCSQEAALGKDDGWLRNKGSPTDPNMRILGRNTGDLRRDLSWWVPSSTAGVVKLRIVGKKNHKSTIEIQDLNYDSDMERLLKKEEDKILPGNTRSIGYLRDRIVGHGYEEADEETSNEISDDEITFDGYFEDEEWDQEMIYLGTQSDVPLKVLFSQDMFTAFMWSMAKTLKNPIGGGSEIQLQNPTSIDTWKDFAVRNDRLSKLVRDIHNTRLGSPGEIYMCIIPPLSREKKLPVADEIVELARKYAEPLEEVQQWEQAGSVYLWLSSVANSFPVRENIRVKSTSVLMEFMRALKEATDLREELQWKEWREEEKNIQNLKDLHAKIKKEIRRAGKRTLCTFIELYKRQHRGWKHVPIGGEETRDSEGERGTEQDDITNWTPLHHAIMDNKPLELSAFQEHINSPDISSWMPLHYAVAIKKEGVIKELVKKGAGVNVRDLLGWTPLHYACQEGDIPIIHELVRSGANLDLKARNGVAPLHCAVMRGHSAVIKVFQDAGATLDIRDASGGTPLHWAAYRGFTSPVEDLWQHANTELRDHNGRTALHLAAIAGKEEVVNLLVDKLGVDMGAGDRYGRKALHWAAIHGRRNVVKLLLDLGDNVDARADSGQTPLQWATATHQADVVKLLVEEGADVEAKNDHDERVLHYAAFYNAQAIIKYLADEHEPYADITAKNCHGQIPQRLASLRNHKSAERLLRDLWKKRFGDDKHPST